MFLFEIHFTFNTQHKHTMVLSEFTSGDPVSYPTVEGDIFPMVKWSGREAYPLPLSIALLTNSHTYTRIQDTVLY